MITIKGKRNSAIIYADKIDKATKTQIASLLREEAYSNSKIRIMPDTHSGKNTVVGTTMTIDKRICPSLLGVDIGCGMETVFIKNTYIDFQKLDDIVHQRIPCGAKVHEAPIAAEFDFERLHCISFVNTLRALRSIGTLGGGNHFIELDICSNGDIVLVIHSGSRQLGSDVALYYQDQAYRYQCKKERRKNKISRYSSSDDYSYYCKAEKREKKSQISVKRESAVLEGELFDMYLDDIAVVQEFADLNRKAMADIICNEMNFEVKDRFTCVHNYIDTEHMILRKGAVSARRNERVIIPLNMRDGAILGYGLGNVDWNFSAPHGAGRACSRSDAKYAYTVEEFQEQMKGVYTTTANEGSLDECPMAYKSIDRIIDFVCETVKIDEIIKPIYNFKSC